MRQVRIWELSVRIAVLILQKQAGKIQRPADQCRRVVFDCRPGKKNYFLAMDMAIFRLTRIRSKERISSPISSVRVLSSFLSTLPMLTSTTWLERSTMGPMICLFRYI